VAGQAAESFGGRLKLKGMTVFSAESSWCVKAMSPESAPEWPVNALIFGGKGSNEVCAIFSSLKYKVRVSGRAGCPAFL